MSDGQMHLAGKREGIRGELRRNVLGQLKDQIYPFQKFSHKIPHFTQLMKKEILSVLLIVPCTKDESLEDSNTTLAKLTGFPFSSTNKPETLCASITIEFNNNPSNKISVLIAFSFYDYLSGIFPILFILQYQFHDPHYSLTFPLSYVLVQN